MSSMPYDASIVETPKPEPACEKCGGVLERLTRLPKFDHPTFDIFRCLACGVVSWIAREDEQGSRTQASKLAARELEKLGSQSLPEPDLQQRKRTLIRGPKEFREMRVDLAKPKA